MTEPGLRIVVVGLGAVCVTELASVESDGVVGAGAGAGFDAVIVSKNDFGNAVIRETMLG